MKTPTTIQPQAHLPSEHQEDLIEDMQPGDTGWTVPWAMYADASAALWLNGRYTIHASPHGTVQMRVWRDENDGCWRVDASGCRGKWALRGGHYSGDFRPLPVAHATF